MCLCQSDTQDSGALVVKPFEHEVLVGWVERVPVESLTRQGHINSYRDSNLVPLSGMISFLLVCFYQTMIVLVFAYDKIILLQNTPHDLSSSSTNCIITFQNKGNILLDTVQSAHVTKDTLSISNWSCSFKGTTFTTHANRFICICSEFWIPAPRFAQS